ncbi:ankyrin-3-like [Saccostrea cucullata]|uniref:ankyrin-3-like n=1 Tax=Saccostrea cuccullata TaxID=36930 RepID=UPI002ECFBA16
MYPMLVQSHTDMQEKTLLHWAAFSGQIAMFEYVLHLFENDKKVTLTDSQKPTIDRKNSMGETILHTACSGGHEDLSKHLINRYPHLLKVTDLRLENVLHKAARGGSLPLFQFLLDKDKDLRIDEKTNSGRTVLHMCCFEGRKDICKYLVNNYPCLLDITDYYGWTVLHAACLGGNVDIIDFLVAKGMFIHELPNDKESALYIACRYGQYPVCEYLIHNYPQSLDVMDETISVLHRAAWEGYIDIVNLLVEKGWDVTSVTRTGNTVLHLCCLNSQIEMCQYLINNYSNLLRVRDDKGWTVLHSACKGGNEEIVSLLITKGIDIDALTKDSKNALHIASLNGKYQICQYLVNNYKHLLKNKDKYGNSVLHCAAMGGDVNVLEMLIKFGSNISTLTNEGETVLHVCGLHEKMKVFTYLIDNFPDLLEVKDKYGFTVLHSVCKGGNTEMIPLLITKGLDILELTNDTQNVLEIACLRGKYDTCEYLLKYHPQLLNVRESLLHSTVIAGNVEIVKLLIEKGIHIESLNNKGETVLHVCCRRGKIKMINYLVNNNENLLDIKDPDGGTALHSACKFGDKKVVSLLIRKGANINSLTKSGKSVLHNACLNGKFDACKYLIDNYQQILNVKDKLGNTALHDAAFGGNVEIVKLLIEKEMNVKTLRNNGETVLHLCCRGGNLDLCKYLLNKYSFLREIRDNEGCTVLHSACKSGNVDLFSYLAANGLDIKALTKNGANVLHIACLHSSYKIFEYLFNNCLQLLDISDKQGRSVLDNAVIGGNIAIVKKLIDNELSVGSVRKNNETLLHFCCREGKLKMCKFLVNKCRHLLLLRDKQGKTVLHSACEGGSVETCSFLLEKGMDINAVTNGHESVLHIACQNGQYDLCGFLIDKFPSLLRFLDKDGRSVLHDAAMGGNIDIVKLLIGKWIDVRNADEDGETISHFCCSHEHLTICEYLVNCYSDLLHLRDRKGWTVLHSACKGGNVEIISYLVDCEININDLTNDGKSVLHIACLYHMYDACEFLLIEYPHLLDVEDCNGNTVLESAFEAGDIDIICFLSSKKNVNNIA